VKRLLMLWILSFPSLAAVDPQVFDSAAQEQQYKSLVMELRCPKCQNQAIGSSDAPIANDMRAKVYEFVRQGQDNEQIIGWLEQRYGEYIRYKPSFGGSTLWLWLLPPGLLILGAIVGARVLTRKRALTAEDRAEADQLLGIDRG
jgi:cytochrome c-type biogenesis protein CcmH